MATARKAPVKKAVAKKARVAKKAVAKKAVAKKASYASRAAKMPVGQYQEHPPGYAAGPGGLSVPATKRTPKPKVPASIVPPSKMEAGFKTALESVQRLLNDSVGELAESIKQSLEIEKLELSLSFNAKGEFLGIGVGGAASIKVCLRPLT